MKIYLAGSVPKGDEEAKTFEDWRARYKKELEKIFDAEYINPLDRNIDESDPAQVFGLDCTRIKKSDLVIIYAEERLGPGTSQEMVIAKYFKKPVVTVLPKGTYHRKTNVVFSGKIIEDWIHPFLLAFSDVIVESIEEIEGVKDKILQGKIKDMGVIDEALEYISKNHGK